jgi:CheY-like chemotaxis protein
VGQLAGGVAHDFNNVLGTILAALHSLQVATRGDKRFEPDLDQIRDLCAQGGEFTRRLLAVGRRGAIGVGPVNLSELMASLQLLLSHTLPKNIRLEFQVAPRLPAVAGNRADLLTAFLNLALNARDAMPDGGRLAIRCRPEPSTNDSFARVAIDVSDTGCGIPLEIQDRIFEPFFTTKPHGVGTGLGLATVYATITEAGGDIHVSSLPGRGATFNLRLPPAARSDNTKGAQFLNGGYILVAEKDPATALEVVKILEDAGYSTLKAGTGIEVLEILRDRREHIELLFLGGELPDQRATAVRRCLKLMAPEIPVCCVCGIGEGCEAEGPHLLKPFAPDDLLRAVGELLDAKNRT